MNIKEVMGSYEEIIAERSSELTKLKNTIFQIGTLRLIVVVAEAVACYILWGNTQNVAISILIAVIVFLALLQFHNRLFRKKRYCELQIENARNELDGLNYNFSAFDGAPEKIDGEHSFSLDLDLFGNRSFFQSINRSVTSFGKDLLSETLLNPIADANKIAGQQEAIKELSLKRKLMFHFRTIGQMSGIDALNLKDWTNVFSQAPSFYKNKFWTSLTFIVPAVYLIFAILYFLGMIAGMWFIPLYLVTMVISYIPAKKVERIVSIFDKKTTTLQKYAQLFEIIENEEYESEILRKNKDQLKSKQMASKSIARLCTFYSYLMMSSTYPLLFFFCPVLFFHVRYARLIEKWSEIEKEHINDWFTAMGRFDALVSMATYAYNHPDYAYPQTSDTFVFDGKGLGHPLINRDVCVRNDVQIGERGFFLVVTGANMAGKSTYLRTVGINHTIAGMGMPVCAESLMFYPGQLVTNLRTADSLADNESYFFAELKRLKMIIDRLQSGEELFIILDEILKGTNSEDKQKGSLALMKQLISLQSNGIIATHDLVLGKLESEYPDHVKNYCFEADIKNDKLSFTYKIRKGVAQNMNACFLMRKMGITGI
ncbi:MAG: MutS-related protein [Dysgonomonas sp.]